MRITSVWTSRIWRRPLHAALAEVGQAIDRQSATRPYEPMTEEVQPQIGIGRCHRWCIQIDFSVDDFGADGTSLVVDRRRDESDGGCAAVGHA